MVHIKISFAYKFSKMQFTRHWNAKDKNKQEVYTNVVIEVLIKFETKFYLGNTF